jgi:SWI/SNF-related matrix-associated actin-dependent regulator of chromatin subfamily A3
LTNTTSHARQETAEENWRKLLQFGSDLDPKSGQAILDEVGMKEIELANLPEAPMPNGLITELLPYQKQGLGWMLNAEHPKPPSEKEESQFWTLTTISKHKVYYNSATNAVAQGVPRLYRGGILADDMVRKLFCFSFYHGTLLFD